MALTPSYANSVEFSFSFFSKMKKKMRKAIFIFYAWPAREKWGQQWGKKEGKKEKRKRRVGEGGSEVSERASEK